MWKVEIKEQKTRDFLKSSDPSISSDVGTYFLNIANILAQANGSKLCTSGIYPVKSFTEGTLEIHYHIDSTKQEIRITNHLIIRNS